jgi:hypothetical protein
MVGRCRRAIAPYPPSVSIAEMQIEYALIADHAEIVSGKLYLMGGGWDVFYAAELPAQARIALALGVRVGWEETNKTIPMRAFLEDDDGKEFVRIEGSLNVGRPAHLPPGSRQLAQMAANLPVALPDYGGYRVRIIVGDAANEEELALPFRVVRRQ